MVRGGNGDRDRDNLGRGRYCRDRIAGGVG